MSIETFKQRAALVLSLIGWTIALGYALAGLVSVWMWVVNGARCAA
jgi:hypothetical protein